MLKRKDLENLGFNLEEMRRKNHFKYSISLGGNSQLLGQTIPYHYKVILEFITYFSSKNKEIESIQDIAIYKEGGTNLDVFTQKPERNGILFNGRLKNVKELKTLLRQIGVKKWLKTKR